MTYLDTTARIQQQGELKQEKETCCSQAGGVEEEGAAAGVENGEMDQNTRAVLVSLRQERQIEEAGGGQGQRTGRTTGRGRGAEAVRGGRGGRGRGAVSRAGQGQVEEARRGRGQGRSPRGGGNADRSRGRGGRGRGWVQSGENRRKCVECNGEFLDQYIYHHIRELCPGRREEESSEEEVAPLEAEEDDVSVDNIMEEVNDLEISVFERDVDVEDRRREKERKKKKVEEQGRKRPLRFLSGSSSSSSASPVQRPARRRQQVAASSPPSNTRPNPPAPTTPPVLASPPSPLPARSPYHLDLGPQLAFRRTEDVGLDMPDTSSGILDLAGAGAFTLVACLHFVSCLPSPQCTWTWNQARFLTDRGRGSQRPAPLLPSPSASPFHPPLQLHLQSSKLEQVNVRLSPVFLNYVLVTCHPPQCAWTLHLASPPMCPATCLGSVGSHTPLLRLPHQWKLRLLYRFQPQTSVW